MIIRPYNELNNIINNDAMDALTRFLPIESDTTESDIKRVYLAESYCVDKLYSDPLP